MKQSNVKNYKKDMQVKDSIGRKRIAFCLNEFRKTRSISLAAKKLNLSFFTLYGILRNSKVFNRTFTRYKHYSHSDHSKAMMWAKKITAIKYLGGKCHNCSDKNIFHLSFHHTNPKEKEEDIRSLARGSWEKLVIELNKCVLLCRNCHQEKHSNENNHAKKKLLKMAKKEKCDKCGYSNKNLSSLSFHHIKPQEKKFSLSKSCRFSKRKEMRFFRGKKETEKEIKKCDVLCFNCHSEKHTDIEKIIKLKKLIFHKVHYTIPYGKANSI